jgi:hypothetical protein
MRANPNVFTYSFSAKAHTENAFNAEAFDADSSKFDCHHH